MGHNTVSDGHDRFSKISRTLFDFQNNTHWVSLFQRNNSLIFQTGVSCFPVILFYFTLLAILEKQLANIPDRGFLCIRNTLLLYSLSPYSQTERQTESQIHSLRGAGGTFFPVVLLWQFFVLAGNRFWFYILLMYFEYHTVVVLCFFWFWREIVFGVRYVLSVHYSCAVESVFLLWRES